MNDLIHLFNWLIPKKWIKKLHVNFHYLWLKQIEILNQQFIIEVYTWFSFENDWNLCKCFWGILLSVKDKF